MDSMETNDIKAHFIFFLNGETLQMEISHFHGGFCSFRDFFPLFLSLCKENVQFLAQDRPGRFVLCCGLGNPAKGCAGAFMKLLNQNQKNKAEISKGSWANVSISQEGRMVGINQLSPLKEKL